ncbi:MAG: hypothetical protein DHS80DRAFT_23532 [Piptocephalis tieghemiana]|nr:MAG: hypothetical protein DHS80DRAFT_23532 [Piptocephalis tieghemiana]
MSDTDGDGITRESLILLLVAFASGAITTSGILLAWRCCKGICSDSSYMGPNEDQPLLGTSRETGAQYGHVTLREPEGRRGRSLRMSTADATKRRISRPFHSPFPPLPGSSPRPPLPPQLHQRQSYALTAPTIPPSSIHPSWPYANPLEALAPPPPLPRLHHPIEVEERQEGEAGQREEGEEEGIMRWSEHHRKHALVQSVLGAEPPLGRHLRMAIRSTLHLSQVSPEAIALHPHQSTGGWFTRAPRSRIPSGESGWSQGRGYEQEEPIGGEGEEEGYMGGDQDHADRSISFRSSYEQFHTARASLKARVQVSRNRTVKDVRSLPWLFAAVGDEQDGQGQDDSPGKEDALGTSLPTSPGHLCPNRARNSMTSLDTSSVDSPIPERDQEEPGKEEPLISPALSASITLPVPEDTEYRERNWEWKGMERRFSDRLPNGNVPLQPSKPGNFRRASTPILPGDLGETDLEGGSRNRRTHYQTPPQSPFPTMKTARTSQRALKDPTSPSSSHLPAEYFTDFHTHTWNILGYGRVKFVDHAPHAYSLIRRLLGYDLDQLDEALRHPFSQVLRSSGKSDAIFFATSTEGVQRRFLLKTLRDREPEALRSLLPDYLDHLERYPDTLLPRFLGCFEFERPSRRRGEDHGGLDARGGLGLGDGRGGEGERREGEAQELPARDSAFPVRMHLVLMADVFDTDVPLNERYDFKGSDRERSSAPSGDGPLTSSQTMSKWILKEKDFLHRVRTSQSPYIALGSEGKRNLLLRLQRDVSLLRQTQNYFFLIPIPPLPFTQWPLSSLLVGVAVMQRKRAPTPPNTRVRPSAQSTMQSQQESGESLVSEPISSTETAHEYQDPSSSAGLMSIGEGMSGGDGSVNPTGLLLTATQILSSILGRGGGSMGSGGAQGHTDLEEGRRERRSLGTHEDSLMELRDSGIINPPQSILSPFSAPGGVTPEGGQLVYLMGLCDVLQKYTLLKWMERGWKDASGRVLGSSGWGDGEEDEEEDEERGGKGDQGDKEVEGEGRGPQEGKMDELSKKEDGPEGKEPYGDPLSPSHGIGIMTSEAKCYPTLGDGLRRRVDKHGLIGPSVEEPGKYGERLIRFVESITL